MAGQAASDDAATQYAARPEDFFAKGMCSGGSTHRGHVHIQQDAVESIHSISNGRSTLPMSHLNKKMFCSPKALVLAVPFLFLFFPCEYYFNWNESTHV